MLTSSLIEARLARVILGLGAAAALSACSSDMSRMSYYNGQPQNDVVTGSVNSQPYDSHIASQELPPDPNPSAPRVTYGNPQPVYVAPRPVAAQTPYRAPVYAAPKAPATPLAQTSFPPAPSHTRLGWSAADGTQITVRAGQTPAGLARQYGIPEDALLQVNGLPANARLMPGTRIVIPSYNAAALVPHGNDGPTIAPRPPVEAPLPPQQVAALPPRVPQPSYAPPPRPRPWTPVQASGGAMRQTAAQTAAMPVLQMPGRAGIAPDNPQLATGSVRPMPVAGAYIVRPGETLATIAKGFHIHLHDLAAANGLRPSDNLRLGQRLLIPASPATPAAGRPGEVVTQSVAPRAVVAPAAQPIPPAVAAPADNRASASPDASQNVSFRWPVKGRMLSSYGNKGNGERNDGVNIEAPAGTVVRAAEAGEVVYAGKLGGYGNLVLIKHGNGYVTAYAYDDEMLVHRGDKVARGQSIATVGTSGAADTPQLHFEIRSNNRPVDPVPFLGG